MSRPAPTPDTSSGASDLDRRLVEIVRASPWFTGALRHAPDLGLSQWCIGAGAVRNLSGTACAAGTNPRRWPASTSPAPIRHGFKNDTTPRYDAAAATTARASTLALFNRTPRT